ncbi:MAG: hypothetical protein LBH07_09055, partial [Treponema sp.]|nr:hypothetical protein [Treponema sp.]
MFFKKIPVFFVFPVLFLTGCVTSVSFQVQRAPAMNTAGIRRIAIMPFETSSNTSLQRDLAQFITATAITKIKATQHFTLVDHSEILRLQRNGENIYDHVDALFTGQIVSMRTNDSSHIEEKKDPKTEKITEVIIYDREVELIFSYRLIRSRDGSIIDLVTREGKKEDHKESRNSLESNLQMLQTIVASSLAGLERDIAPYNTYVQRTLMEEKSKDKDLKAKMKDVQSIVKGGNYSIALNRYNEIYGQYGNFAAVYNAAVMYEALKDIPVAVLLMEKVFGETGNPTARDYLNRLNRELREQSTLAALYSDTGNPREKIITYAVDEVGKILPRG